MELSNVRHETVKVTLVKGKLPVPKYIWKIVYEPDLKECIVLIVLNNPFTENKENPEFCENICHSYGWGNGHWSDFKKGYVFCCQIENFRKFVKYVPDLSVKRVLRGQ